jgi:hypothetical protein
MLNIKQKNLIFVFIIVAILSVLTIFAVTSFGGNINPFALVADTDWFDADATATVFEIHSAEQLLGLAELVNGGETSFSNTIINLKNNLILPASPSWEPIGTVGNPFRGTFDGNGKKIEGLNVDKSDNFVGLFGFVNGGTIRNLGVFGSVDGGDFAVGGVVGGVTQGNILNVYAKINVTGADEAVGGIAGNISSTTVTNSVFAGEVAGGESVGGIAGAADALSTITHCFVLSESISGSDATLTGRIAGSGGLATWQQNFVLETTLALAGLPALHSDERDGEAREGHPFEIVDTNVHLITQTWQLAWLRDEINSNKNDLSLALRSANLRLGNSISLGFFGTNWEPISSTQALAFMGIFDGASHEILELNIVKSSEFSGLFGFVEGTVRNLGLAGVNIAGANRTGGIAGRLNAAGGNVGLIENCFVTGTISGAQDVGGIAGLVQGGTIWESFSNVTLNGTGFAGGIAGRLTGAGAVVGLVQNSYSVGSVTATTAGNIAGGIVGSLSVSGSFATIANSYATNSIEGQTAGGIAGQMQSGGRIENSAAFNERVIATSVTVGSARRIVGQFSGGTLANNHAFNGMTVRHGGESGTNFDIDASLLTPDGANLAIAQITGDESQTGTIRGLFAQDFWTISQGKLPVLKNTFASKQNFTFPHLELRVFAAGTVRVVGENTYDGTVQRPSLVWESDNAPLFEGTHYTIVPATDNNINSGTGKISIVGINNYSGTLENIEFTINKKNPTYANIVSKDQASLNMPTGLVYIDKNTGQGIGDVQFKNLATLNVVTSVTVTIEYRLVSNWQGAQSGSSTTALPVDAGTYAVTAVITNGTNYNNATIELTNSFTIARKATFVAEDFNFGGEAAREFNGGPQIVEASWNEKFSNMNERLDIWYAASDIPRSAVTSAPIRIYVQVFAGMNNEAATRVWLFDLEIVPRSTFIIIGFGGDVAKGDTAQTENPLLPRARSFGGVFDSNGLLSDGVEFVINSNGFSVNNNIDGTEFVVSEVRYRHKSNNQLLTGAPKNVGIYIVEVLVEFKQGFTSDNWQTGVWVNLGEIAINRAEVDVPNAQALTFNGLTQFFNTHFNSAGNRNSAPFNISSGSEINVGTRTATLTLKNADSFVWRTGDPSNAVRTVQWTIAQKEVAMPTAESVVFGYNGSPHTLDWVNRPLTQGQPDFVVLNQTDRETNAGVYTVVVQLRNGNFKWADGFEVNADGTYSFAWTIEKATVAVDGLALQLVGGNAVFDGAEKSVVLQGGVLQAVLDLFEIGGETKGTNAGTYTVTLTLKDPNNFRWATSANGAVHTITWTIEFAVGASARDIRFGAVSLVKVTNRGANISILDIEPLPLGQEVEFALGTSATEAPANGWQTSLNFNGLNRETQYFLFVRGRANENINASVNDYLLIEIEGEPFTFVTELLSGGEIAGISIGAVIVAGGLGVAGFILLKNSGVLKKLKAKLKKPEAEDDEFNTTDIGGKDDDSAPEIEIIMSE